MRNTAAKSKARSAETYRAARRNGCLRGEVKGIWPSSVTARGPAPCDWTPYAQTRGGPLRPRAPRREYTGVELRSIRSREVNYLGEVQR